MDMKERLVKDIKETLADLMPRLERLGEMDVHSLRSFSSILNQASKDATSLTAVTEFEEYSKMRKK